MTNCLQCQTAFEITDADRAFYERVSPVVEGKKYPIQDPTLCPNCRQIRRLSFTNQMNLYRRKCDATGEEMISMYPPDSTLTIYSQKYWASEKFDAIVYGRDFDFNRPFFEQWRDLANQVPRSSLTTDYVRDENSAYTNYAGRNKNCYMLFDSDYNHDCWFGHGNNSSKSCLDNNRIRECELCYECIDCVKCYGLSFSQDCENCSNSAFLKNCIGVKNSFMCSNLKNKEYHIFNQPFPKEKFEQLMKSLASHSELAKYFEEWKTFRTKFPQKYMHGIQNENVVGDYLIQSKNAEYCFDSMELWDCKYFTRSFGSTQNAMDCDECGDHVSNFYECNVCGYDCQNVIFCNSCFSNNSDLMYCTFTQASQNCFGCFGLVRKKFCILNKQYTKEQYEELAPRIIEHMKKTGEWGEFFPMKYSDFAYNESVAQEYHPMTKEQVLAKGLRWRDSDKKEYLMATAEIPDNCHSVDVKFCKELLVCEDCGKNYKIIEHELQFHQQQNLALPKKCFSCRYQNRFRMRNPRKLFDRTCDQCGLEIKTTYAPDRPEKVYCEKCYQDSLV